MTHAPSPSVVTPGNYDGVHRGHRALVSCAREQATAHGGLRVVALTFDPHPMHVLAPERAPMPLTTPGRRTQLLEAAGADEVVVQRFDRALAEHSAERFVRELLVGGLGARSVVVGHDFRFGRGREGDEAFLRRWGARLGFEVHALDAVTHGGVIVSSSAIRQAIAAGDLPMATALLGRVHDLEGAVVEGDKRGRTIGFPTANLVAAPVLHPPDGVYAVVAKTVGAAADAGPLRWGVANLGVRPTFEAGRSLEVHLLDAQVDLYGATLRVGFVARLRGEQRFSGLEALKAQIARDVEQARRALDQADPETLRWM